MNLSDPMYKMVVEPIMERIMEANEIGREYAERYIRDTVDSAVESETYHMGVEIAALTERINELEDEVDSLMMTVSVMIEDQQSNNNKSWLSRLLGR